MAAQNRLPALRHAARGREDVVPAVSLVHLGALDGGMILCAVKEQVVIADEDDNQLQAALKVVRDQLQ